MYVRASSDARDRLAKSEERNACGAQVRHQRLTFCAVGMHGHVNRIAVIESEAVMHRGLSEGADGKRAVEPRKEKALNFNGIGYHPTCRAIVTN